MKHMQNIEDSWICT